MARRTGELNFDFQSYASPIDSNFPSGIGYQASSQSAYPSVPPQHGHQHPAYPHHGVSQASKAGDKRRSTEPQTSSRPMSIEEASRVAAEEDKRRRNTAASARFRVKKKQREQALEKSAKEMSDRVQALEAKITQLETENTWLKKLILEKNDGTSGTTKDDMSKLTTNGTKDEIKVETGKAKDAKKDA